jgi:cytochrome d ubiquinol oxidase subunit I
MDPTALLLSRIQFGFTISFHIIFPAFTIGLAAWLTVLEALQYELERTVEGIGTDSRSAAVL